MRLEDYCCVCGQKIDPPHDKAQVGFRGPTEDTPAFACGACIEVHSNDLSQVISAMRFIKSRKVLLGKGGAGSFICAKPIDAEEWKGNDRFHEPQKVEQQMFIEKWLHANPDRKLLEESIETPIVVESEEVKEKEESQV